MHTACSKRLGSMMQSMTASGAIFETRLISEAERRMAPKAVGDECGSVANSRLQTNQMKAEESLDHSHVTDRRHSKCLIFGQPMKCNGMVTLRA